MKYETAIKRLTARKQRLSEQAAALAETEIKRILGELNQRFPRHRFRFSQGMGSISVWSAPAIYGDDLISPLVNDDRLSDMGRRFPAFRYLAKQVNRMIQIADDIDEIFDINIGDVESGQNREAE